MGLQVHARGNELTLVGQPDQVELARTLLVQLHGLARRGRALPGEEVVRAIHALREDSQADVKAIFTDTVLVTSSSIPVSPKSLAQKRYIDAIRDYDIVFGIGPAGTGKTYLAMAMAVAPWSAARSSASCSPARPSRRARGSASCPAIWPRR